MTQLTPSIRRTRLLAGAASTAVLLSLTATPAYAQDQAQGGATTATSAAPADPQAQSADQGD